MRAGDLIYDAASLTYAFLVIPLYASTIYGRAVRRRINSVQREVEAPANQVAVLENTPHTSALWWVPVAFMGIAILGVLAGKAIPPYKAYVSRAQVMERIQLTAPVRAAVANY